MWVFFHLKDIYMINSNCNFHFFTALKATFDIKVSAPKNRVVLSNMPLIEESKDEEDPIAYR